MTTVLGDEDGNAMNLKKQLLNGSNVKEESRSYLNVSRENLDISQTDLEQGFNKHRFRPNRYMVLSTSALLIALLCFGLETWKLRCSLANAREIEELKRDVKNLKHRFLQQDLLNELKAFEEQLYANDPTDDEDPEELDIENAEYDSNYDDEDSSSSHDYSGDYRTLPIISKSPDVSKATTSTITRTPMLSTSTTIADSETTSTPGPVSDKALVEILAAVRKVEAKRGEEFEKNVRNNHRNIERERLQERIQDINVRGNEEKSKEKHDEIQNEEAADMVDPIKRKRSIRLANEALNGDSTNRPPHQRNQRRKITASRHRLRNKEESGKGITNDERVLSSSSALSTERHPPKKFYSHAHQEMSRAFPSRHHDDDNLSMEIARSTIQSGKEGKSHTIGRSNTDATGVSRNLRRVITKRHLRTPRQVCAAHYSADTTLFTENDKHEGNGRVRHENDVFKAWKPSYWVSDLGMNEHFTLGNNGELIVNELGLFLVYAQIHYIDQHDENGFHLLVNGEPVLQCMAYSHGEGNKSQSCFSAQVTFLQVGDILVLKDIGGQRYTLFHRDKSFFGLVKLGESKQNRHPSTQPPL